MAITTDIGALIYLIKNTSAIISQVGLFSDGTNKIVCETPIPESETNLPAIAITAVTGDNFYTVHDNFYNVNCHAETQGESLALARSVNNLFYDGSGDADNYSLVTSSTILQSISDIDSVNTPVRIRVKHIGD